MTSAQYVNWSEIDSIVEKLSDVLSKSTRKFTMISTISRGGLIPSRLLADRLGIEKILVDEEIISDDSLFVDDIFDSGETFAKILSKTNNPSKLLYVTLFARRGKEYPSQLIYGNVTESDSYVVFPWDKFEFENSK